MEGSIWKPLPRPRWKPIFELQGRVEASTSGGVLQRRGALDGWRRNHHSWCVGCGGSGELQVLYILQDVRLPIPLIGLQKRAFLFLTQLLNVVEKDCARCDSPHAGASHFGSSEAVGADGEGGAARVTVGGAVETVHVIARTCDGEGVVTVTGAAITLEGIIAADVEF